MPSPGEDVQSWSVTAGNNGAADPLINWAEGQTRASVNNSSRSEMAAIAKWRNLLNGSIVTTGSANAHAFLSGLTYTSIPTNLAVRLKIGSGLTNTASATLNMDGLGDTLIKTADGANLLGGELVANGYVDLLYNGTNWIFLYSQQFIDNQLHGGGGLIIGQQKFETAGTFTYTPTPEMECCIIECIGGGGGGGSALGAVGQSYQGAGGGGGGYSRRFATATDIGVSQLGAVGAGGAGGSPGTNGLNGGATNLGSLCSANGGAGGTLSWGGAAPIAGAGGTVGTGDVAIPGTPGGPGFWSSNTAFTWTTPGNGGAGPLGGGSKGSIGGDGGAATGYGGGGAGGSSHDAAVYANGGAGAAGAVIITEFAGRGAPGRDGATGPVGPTGPSGPGTGDVLRQGVPTAGQVAQWFDASHIQGVNTSTFVQTLNAAKPAFIAYLTADQSSWPASTWAPGLFRTAGFNIGNYFIPGNGRWVPPAGTVSITVQGYFGNVTNYGSVAIYKNGALLRQLNQPNLGFGNILHMQMTSLDICNGSDYYEAYFLLGAVGGGGGTLVSGNSVTFFCGHVL